VENQPAVPPAPLTRHQRWPESRKAIADRVRRWRFKRGIGKAGKAEAKRIRRKAARDKFKAAHPNRKQELAAAKAQAAIEASRRSVKLWFGAPLSDGAALAYIQESILPGQREAAAKYLAQIDAECTAAGLNRNRFTLTRGGVQTAIAQRRRAYDLHAREFPSVEAVKQGLELVNIVGPVSSLEELFQGEAKRIFGNGDSVRAEFDA